MKNVLILFQLFFIYSVLGWIFESTLCSIKDKKAESRGFLIGPYCPIYGTGAILITILLKKYNNDLIALFVMSVLICSIVEYVTSYLMEKIFKARWWDYTHEPFNLNGRICLFNSLGFGLGGSIISYFISPFLIKLLNKMPLVFLYGFSIFNFLVLIIDCIISYRIIHNIPLIAKNLRKDYTEEITEKVREALRNRSIYMERLMNAFPDFKIELKRLDKKK